MMVPAMDNKPLFIPESKRLGGLLVVYCRLCKTNMYDLCRKSGKALRFCPNGDEHTFKCYVSVPGTKYGRRTKTLKTRNLEEARRQALEFKREVQENSCQREGSKEKGSEREIMQKIPDNIISAMARYVGYLYNDPEIVHELRRKERSKKHVADIEHNFKNFVICLKKNGYNPNELSINEVNDQVIGKFHDFILKELKLSNSSYNRAMTELTSLYNYLISEGYQIKNPFKSIPRKQVNMNNETITEEEYNSLLEIIQKPELGKTMLSSGVIKI